jgi:hypothetical protein
VLLVESDAIRSLGSVVERKRETEAKKPWERVSVLIGAVGGVITVFVAVTQQRPASTLAVATAFLLLGGWFAWRVVTAKFKSGRPRFPRGRRATVAGVVLVLSGIGVSLSIPPSRIFVAHTVLGFPSAKKDVKLARLLMSESETNYRLSIVLFNKGVREELVRTVKLNTRCSSGLPTHGPDFYEIKQDFKVVTAPGIALSGSVVHDGEAQYRARVFGNIVDLVRCGRTLNLWFNTSTPLPPNQHVTIGVDVPKKITVLDDRPTLAVKDGVATVVEPKITDLAIDVSRDRTFVVTLMVGDAEISGSPE